MTPTGQNNAGTLVQICQVVVLTQSGNHAVCMVKDFKETLSNCPSFAKIIKLMPDSIRWLQDDICLKLDVLPPTPTEFELLNKFICMYNYERFINKPIREIIVKMHEILITCISYNLYLNANI